VAFTAFVVRFRDLYTRPKAHLFDPTPPSVPVVKVPVVSFNCPISEHVSSSLIVHWKV
jgi:hypothetical protein